jgi:hypothetical protein
MSPRESILPSAWRSREQSKNYSLILQNWAYSFFGRRSGELEGMIIWRLKRLDYIARYEEYIAILLQYRQVFQETKGKANQNHATRSAHKALEEVESVLLDTFDTPEEWEISRGYRQKATVEYQKRVAEHLLAFAKPKLEPKTGDEQVAQLRDLLWTRRSGLFILSRM